MFVLTTCWWQRSDWQQIDTSFSQFGQIWSNLRLLLARGQRESLFQLRDKNENVSYSISQIETRREFFDTWSQASRRDREKFFFNLGHRDEIEIYYLHSQASRREREFFWSDLSFRDENESSKLLTFPEVSDLNGLTNVHANPGRPTIIKCAYDLSWKVFSIAFLLLGLQYHYCPSRRKFIVSWQVNSK